MGRARGKGLVGQCRCITQFPCGQRSACAVCSVHTSGKCSGAGSERKRKKKKSGGRRRKMSQGRRQRADARQGERSSSGSGSDPEE